MSSKLFAPCRSSAKVAPPTGAHRTPYPCCTHCMLLLYPLHIPAVPTPMFLLYPLLLLYLHNPCFICTIFAFHCPPPPPHTTSHVL
jgi:hypothetical protein